MAAIAHLGVGLAAKPLAPEINVGWLVLGNCVLDLLWFGFAAVGLEVWPKPGAHGHPAWWEHTRVVKKPKIEPRMILDLLESVPHPRDRALLAVGCFCGPRTSENFGLTWKSYADDHLIVYDTAYEGALYEGKVKTDDSRARIPIPRRVRPYIEAWRKVCPNTSPDALMFPTQGHRKNKGLAVPFHAKNFFKWKVWPVSDKLGIPRNLCTFQVFRRTLGTDLQKHGTMKDAQAILRHKHIKTTAEVYMDHIPDSVRKAIDARTEAIFKLRRKKRSRKSSGV